MPIEKIGITRMNFFNSMIFSQEAVPLSKRYKPKAKLHLINRYLNQDIVLLVLVNPNI